AAGTQRWLCPQCNASSINPRVHTNETRHFKIFIDWILSGESADHLATRLGVSRRTLTRWFTLLWFITVPTTTDPYRVYDQVFIDGTYFHKKCLLVACTQTHVIAWHWCLRETSYEYLKLLDKIAQPLVVTTDGSGGALKALRAKWPDVRIQRCLVHVQRNTFADISRNPIHPAHKAIRKLGYMLVQVHTPEDAARFTAAVHHTRITFAD
ncbi:transposase, partial [Corynebacterium singulare]|uniref:transposase n=1 Tax=Corynebacterium singulare TaxID=161899 RepID=UPI0011A062E3